MKHICRNRVPEHDHDNVPHGSSSLPSTVESQPKKIVRKHSNSSWLQLVQLAKPTGDWRWYVTSTTCAFEVCAPSFIVYPMCIRCMSDVDAYVSARTHACVCVCACVRAFVYACACACACMYVGVGVGAGAGVPWRGCVGFTPHMSHPSSSILFLG